ncbi:MAG TPA: tetratricopeptide repeat protein [Planctomycetota bacterium]|nr:tetratricopeptide repeat protein [Planctomycetota bacterium]
MPRATGVQTQLSRYEDAWEATHRLIRRGASWSGHERKCFFVQNGRGEFENVSAAFGLDVPEDGRGLATWDFDRDGDLDLILKSRTAPQVRIWRNDHRGGGARVAVELRGTISNRQAIGARVRLVTRGMTRVKEVRAGTGFLSQSSTTLDFGLAGAAEIERLEVRWPAGSVQVFRGLAVNRAYRLVEGSARLEEHRFRPPSGIAAGGPRPASPPETGPAAPPGTPSAPASGDGLTEVWLVDPCPLPDLELIDAGGSRISLSSFHGKPFLLAFWAPECPRCRGQAEEWSRSAAPGAGAPPDVPVLLVVSSAPDALAAGPARQLGLRTAAIAPESLLAMGVLLEEIAHWPREVPVPAAVLADREGRAVKLYRGAVPWAVIARDAQRIPSSREERLEAGLPFPGRYYATDLQRNEFQLGVSYLDAGLDGLALVAFERSLARKPGEPDALYNTGVLLQRRGDAAGARRSYLAALERAPDFADARTNLGVILAEAGRLEEAESEFRRVVEVRGDHAEALINLGNVQLAMNRPAEALQLYARAGRIEPDIPQVQKRIGDACRRVGDIVGARDAYLRATRLAPKDAEAWSNLAVIEAQSGRLEEALLASQTASEADPHYASAHNNRGLILQGLGKDTEALAAFRRAIELRPAMAPASLNLAKALLRAGDMEDARSVLRTFLAVEPRHPEARELLETIEARR